MADLELAGSVGSEMDSAVSVPPPARVAEGAHISSMEVYREMYARSITDPTAFWAEAARSNLTWFRDFTEV